VKLGIVVVYVVRPENGPLLELHLDKIRTLTTVPYTIYAGASRLEPQFVSRLEREPQVKICRLAPTDLRLAEEHSYNLEQLVGAAVDDGVTHVAIMHPDSFPLRSGWAEAIAARFTDDCALATISQDGAFTQYTACLFFPREFWLESKPAFLLSADEQASLEYERFSREHEHNPVNSGVGFVFRAYCEGRSIWPLDAALAESEHSYCTIHGGLIFHLKGAARYEQLTKYERAFRSKTAVRVFQKLRARLKRRVPERIRRQAQPAAFLITNSGERILYSEARAELLADPEAYLDRLVKATDAGDIPEHPAPTHPASY